jgi:aminoglycoside 3-N-acetyltransferase
LGVVPGDVLFVHSSFKSLGPVDGGAGTVVQAMEDAVGPGGTVLMPSFNLVENDKRAETWNHRTSPSTVGWLTEFFRTMPGTVRSDHYSHSVAARGNRAEWFVSGHLERVGMRSPWDRGPWGYTYGTHSPMIRAYQADGKILILGVDYHSSTYMHVVEVSYWDEALRNDPQAEYYWINRPILGEYWDSTGRLRRGKVGNSDSRLFRIRDFVDTLLEAARKEPQRFFKYWPK